MPEIQLGRHTVRSHGVKVARAHMHDWLILLLLVVIDVVLNIIEPFHRFVGKDMMTDLSYPLKDNTVPFWAVPIVAILLPFVIILVYYFVRRDVYDLHHAILGLLYSVLITAVITDAIKDAVGRPRPDFFWRCFPDGKGVFDPVTSNVMCTGLKSVIKEGHKSFPSGHTSWSFAGLAFLSWYMSGKIRAFDRQGHVAKLCLVFLPLLVAALVGISRVDDYWHHWQDVFAGGLFGLPLMSITVFFSINCISQLCEPVTKAIILSFVPLCVGLTVASFCYLQFFPPPCDIDGWGPHAYFQMLAESQSGVQSSNNINHLAVQQTELQSVYIDAQRGMEIARFNNRDTRPMLEGSGN